MTFGVACFVVQINLPVPPLLRPERGVDMLILLDNSAEIREAPSLQLVRPRCMRPVCTCNRR